MLVVIVGAGVAGLSAASALRARGATVLLLEAGTCIGGRAWTSTPPELEQPFDHGASWLHAAECNPLATLAQQAGVTLIDSDATRVRQTWQHGHAVPDAEAAAYDAAETAWHDAARRRLDQPRDTSLAMAAQPLGAEPWLPSVLNWEGPVIAAADSASLSLRDWHANLLLGTNLEVPGGLGAFIARQMGPPAGPVRLRTAVTDVEWGEAGVTVRTRSGAVRADACIVTVSTGVLRAGAIRFSPDLPPATQDALDQLPMGVLNKVAFRAAGKGRLGLPQCCGVDQFVPLIDHPAMTFILWPHGMDHVIGFMGGSHAAALDRAGRDAVLDFASDQVRQVFGAGAAAELRPDGVVTQWASDPYFLGSYAYAIPGGAPARAALGKPLASGRLVFAGEAVRTDGLAGTVGGAFLAGQDAASMVMASTAA